MLLSQANKHICPVPEAALAVRMDLIVTPEQWKIQERVIYTYWVEELAIARSGIVGLPNVLSLPLFSWGRWAFIPTQQVWEEHVCLMCVANCEVPLRTPGVPSESKVVAHQKRFCLSRTAAL